MSDPAVEVEPLWTIRDVARRLNVQIRTIYTYLDDRGLPGVKVAGSWRFKASEVEAWIEQHRTLDE